MDGRIVTAGCACAQPGPPELIDGWLPANQERLGNVASRIQRTMLSRHPDAYGQMALDCDRDRVQLYRKPRPEIDEWILAEFADVCVELIDCRHSDAEMAAIRERVSDDFQYWWSRGVRLYGVSYNIDTDRVEVTTQDLDLARRELPPHYPDLDFEFEYGEGGLVLLDGSGPTRQ